jgi:hypothetical protein
MNRLPIPLSHRLSRLYFLAGLGLLSLPVYTLLCCTISLVRGYPISAVLLPLALLMTGITQFFAAKQLFEQEATRIFSRSMGLVLGLALLCGLFANAIYDTSFDGQWYHQQMISEMKNGFNPYLKTLPVPEDEPAPAVKDAWCTGAAQPGTASDSISAVNLVYLDINHFAKGIEIVEAAVYRLTGRIETGKAVNALALLASLCFCLSLLHRLDLFSPGKNRLIAALAAFNPITVAQLSSYCVDGILYSFFLCLFAVAGLCVTNPDKYYRYALGLLIMICVNIKFTALAYTVVFCGGFLLILLIRRDLLLCKKIFYTACLSGAIGVCFIGFHPYMTNLISTGQPLYGLQETRREIYDITPSLLRDRNRFSKLFISLATRSDDEAASQDPPAAALKIPFSMNRQELLNANAAELKLAGFGPFFSGALLLAVLLLAWTAFHAGRDPAFRGALAVLGIILLSVLIVPDCWWARFVPQCWLLPLLVLLLAEYLSVPRSRLLKPLLYAAIALNVAWALTGILYNMVISSHIRYQLIQLQALSEPISVEYCAYRPFRSNGIRFSENHIRFTERKPEEQYIYQVIHSNTRFGTREALPDLPKPFLMRLNEKLKGGHTY